MTRREDPNWGRDAKRANSDTFYVTNATPQMQPFNAGIWLGLEDYALEHAKQDEMKISVFTGPVLARDDPVFFGVKVPVQFWVSFHRKFAFSKVLLIHCFYEFQFCSG